MIRVLISGVGGDVAQGVIKCLDKTDLDLEIYKISATINSSWLYKDEKSFLSPKIYDDGYIAYLIKFIKKNSIDIFFPCIDLEIPLIAKNKKYIERYNIFDKLGKELQFIIEVYFSFIVFIFIENT